MGDQCRSDELRKLFLFEHLSSAQLDILCADGRIETFPPGPLLREGEPATHFYVLIEGELVMSARIGGADIQTHRTSQPGVYCGAWLAYIPTASQAHEVSIRLTRQSRFFVLDAERFAHFMNTQFPMAVHLLAGHTLGTIRQQQLLGQRARLMALGTITAGLTHHLNNPAAAIARAATDLGEVLGRIRDRFSMVSEGLLPVHAVNALIGIQRDVADHLSVANSPKGTALEAADREELLAEWFDEHGVAEGWDFASTFAEAGLDVSWLQRVSSATTLGPGEKAPSEVLQRALGWLRETVDAELQVREIADASKRISALLTRVKQYSQMDRGRYLLVDVHDLLASTLLMFDSQVGPQKGIRLVTEWDPALPEITCCAGDLNQVWTNIIDNAIEAMNGNGTLTVRTRRDGEDTICVEICDDGPGIDDDIREHIFTAFFTTKPVGEVSGLGLDLAWRIVAQHGGNIAVQSAPGDTRFTVRLPLQPPAQDNPPPTG